MPGINIVGVQFRRAGRIYDFNCKDLMLSEGDSVVVETERGASVAEVMRISYVDQDEKRWQSLKPVLRLATDKDLDSGKLSEEHVVSFTAERVRELDLDMSVIGAEIQLSGNKVIIFFTAPGRVDFRELVKGLASGLKSRIELKQVGARDETKLVGGIGICGREYCCSSFLREFVPVSIKMAKNQNLALNPAKVSGGCGRLLCCLTYEDKVYKELRKKLPGRKAKVRLEEGDEGIVIKSDVLSQKILVELTTGEQVTRALSKVEVLGSKSHDTSSDESMEDDWGADLDVKELMNEIPKESSKPPQRKKKVPRDRRPRKEANTEKSQTVKKPNNRTPQNEKKDPVEGNSSGPEKKKRSRNRHKSRNRGRSRSKSEAGQNSHSAAPRNKGSGPGPRNKPSKGKES